MKPITHYNEKLLMLCISLVVIIFYHLLISLEKPSELVSVDITKLSKEWIIELANNENDPQKNNDELNERIHMLKQILEKEATQRHWIIIPSQNILAGAPDVTPLIKEIFTEHMHEEF